MPFASERAFELDVEDVVPSYHDFPVIRREPAVLEFLGVHEYHVHERVDVGHLSSVFYVGLEAYGRFLVDRLLEDSERSLWGLLRSVHFGTFRPRFFGNKNVSVSGVAIERVDAKPEAENIAAVVRRTKRGEPSPLS